MVTKARMIQFFERAPFNFRSGCMEWLGGISSTGYGKTRLDGRLMDAHRASWIITYGPIPDGMLVCHRCDNRKCVAPAHLFLGTHRDNAVDAYKKGRIDIQRMIDARKPKLSDEDIRAIYERTQAGEKHADIAADYWVSRSTVSYISGKRGKRYAAVLT